MISRRSILETAAALPAATGLVSVTSMTAAAAAEDWQKQAEEARAAALDAFPYERKTVSGETALQEWERLEMDGRGVPVLIGNDEALGNVVSPFHPSYWSRAGEPDLAETLARADQIVHPEGLYELKEVEERRFQQWLREDPEFAEQYERFNEQLRDSGIDVDSSGPPIGRWPDQPPGPAGLTVAMDWRTGRPLDVVHIVIVPTEDWTTVPAYLRWGGWNANPLPEYHVAALRSWRDRYGAELIGVGGDHLNIRVADKPSSRDEALALAREHYAYCPDTIDQGMGTLSNLAAFLMAHDWWFFWWD